ncbi:MAG: S24 family peptidase [Treponema sp.]|nr:S24 family peptidase [Treponema sp.]
MEADEFWKKVKLRLSELGKNQEWLCLQSEILLGSLRNKIHLHRLPSLDESMKIIKALGLSWEEFEGYPDEIKEKALTIPVYDQVFSAGYGQFMPENAEVIDYVAVPKELRHSADKLGAVYVKGDSMEPTLSNGDIIICDGMGYDGNDGIYAIIYKGSGFVKRLQKDGDYISIISDNKFYESKHEPGQSEDLKIIGKVRYVLHKV